MQRTRRKRRSAGFPARLLPALLLAGLCLSSGIAGAGCVNPAGQERDLVYNNDYHVLQFCNGSAWIAAGAAVGGSFMPPAGSGFFVLTGTTYNGNLGGLAGANAKCLTELKTTHTTWKGYATANANGQLVAGKVRAFMCSYEGAGYPAGGNCNQLEPSTTYYFANASDTGKGGASFTTDAARVGPHDYAKWSATDHFGVAVNYWNSRSYIPSDYSIWDMDIQSGDNHYHCSQWTSNSSGMTGALGSTDSSSFARWIGNTGEGQDACNNPHPLVCYVNP